MNSLKIKPLEFRIVVLPDSIEEKLGSGIIIKAETTKVTDRRTQTKGEIVAVSECAFSDWKGRKPKVGERIEFAMYSGQFYIENETEYRILNDDDVVGILEPICDHRWDLKYDHEKGELARCNKCGKEVSRAEFVSGDKCLED